MQQKVIPKFILMYKKSGHKTFTLDNITNDYTEQFHRGHERETNSYQLSWHNTITR